jgi:hypothetical protein
VPGPLGVAIGAALPPGRREVELIGGAVAAGAAGTTA